MDSKPDESLPVEAFDEFYSEVKEIEKRDSVLTSKQQMDRLNRPGSTYFNLNPYDVLQVDPDTPMIEVKKKYRVMSLLVHPDKNADDSERAQKSFDAVSKAYKTLENEEGFRRCQQIVDEAKSRVEQMMVEKKKRLKKEGKSTEIEEDDPDKLKHAIYVQTCKLFADLERLRVEQDMKNANERKRKAEHDEEEKEKAAIDKEWQKNYDESRECRVNSWREFSKSKAKKTKKSTFEELRPPKTKMEQRPQ